MENEMIERVARAIYANADNVIAWEHVMRAVHERYVRAARAAIEAMRPELDAIQKELADNAADLGGEGYFRRSEDVSRLCAKIDAALQKTPQTAEADPG